MKRVIAIAALVVSAACSSAQGAPSPTPAVGSAAAARTANVTRGSVEQTVRLSGSVRSEAQYRLGPKQPGRLAERLVAPGDRVQAGQILAKLETGELQAAVIAAQARYDQVVAGASPEDLAIARNQVDAARRTLDLSQKSTQNDLATAQQSLDSARRTLDQTRQGAANDLASAQQAFDRIKTSYSSARSTFSTLSARTRSDITAYQSALARAKDAVATALSAAGDPSLSDVQTTLTGAVTSLTNAIASASGPVQDALSEMSRAGDQVSSAANAFDGAVSAGSDPGAAVSQFQSAQTAYALAAGRLSGALDVPAAYVAAASAAVTSANNALNTYYRSANSRYDDARAAIAPVVPLLESDAQLAGAIKAEIGQADLAFRTMGETIGGAYVGAQQALVSAKTRSDSAVASAEAGVTAAERSYTSAQDRITSAITGQKQALDSAELALQRASAPAKAFEIAAAYAALLSAQSILEGATVRAPVAGTVLSITAEVGETVSGPFLVLNAATLQLFGSVGENDVARLTVGQTAQVRIDAIGGTAMSGKIASIDAGATQGSIPLYGVAVVIASPEPGVRTGMSGSADIVVTARKDVLVVPSQVVRSQGTRTFVQVMKDGQISDRDVKVGAASDTVTEIASGLAEGEVVIYPRDRTR